MLSTEETPEELHEKWRLGGSKYTWAARWKKLWQTWASTRTKLLIWRVLKHGFYTGEKAEKCGHDPGPYAVLVARSVEDGGRNPRRNYPTNGTTQQSPERLARQVSIAQNQSPETLIEDLATSLGAPENGRHPSQHQPPMTLLEDSATLLHLGAPEYGRQAETTERSIPRVTNWDVRVITELRTFNTTSRETNAGREPNQFSSLDTEGTHSGDTTHQPEEN
ncbi:hypothetical protein R1sor_012129 [Riccia sorocarpa]|uniref:Reverse transcriptase zinc-binding domain-containing protein n=1 Tax=Riccia sorocarpa TaxID=122646 RepID=A0ABD3I2X0_9MARC